jgi:hypothetical protein
LIINAMLYNNIEGKMIFTGKRDSSYLFEGSGIDIIGISKNKVGLYELFWGSCS